ncbi:MAG: HAD-IA family hydrolase [bacterium]|nr:HAD-IA family hydrolase [bacterium]
MTKNKVIIFDFDGTLADTFSTVIEIVNGMSKEYGYEPLGIELISALRHKRAQDIIKIFRVPIWRIPKLLFVVKDALGKKIGELLPFEGIPEMLSQLKSEGYVIGILSSNNLETVEEFVKKNKIDQFDFIYVEKNLFGKARVLKNLMKRKEFDPNYVVYVGDETRDIEAAKKAGIKIISVDWGFNAVEALEKLSPDYLISKPEELPEIVRKL